MTAAGRGCVDDDDDVRETFRAKYEAYHLEYGQVFLPPQVLLHLGPEGGQHVVHVHDDVHERVQ